MIFKEKIKAQFLTSDLGRLKWGVIFIIFCLFLALCDRAIAEAADVQPPTSDIPHLAYLTRHASGVVEAALDNGLTLVIKENHASKVVTAYLCVRAGSIYEGEYLGSGIAHLTEHIVSGGSTRKRTEAQCEEILDAIGGVSNAYTSRNYITYFISTTSEHTAKAIDLLADWATNCLIAEKEFQRELAVLKREQGMRQDKPEHLLHQTALENVFKVHPTRFPIMGYPSLLSRIKREDVEVYYKRTHNPANMVLVVVGDFEEEEVLRLILEAFKQAERRPLPAVEFASEPAQLGIRRREIEAPVSVSYLRMDFRTVSLFHEDLYPLDVTSYILSHGVSSRLVRRIRDELKLVTSIETWSVTPPYDAGYFAVYAVLSPEKLPLAEAAILNEIYALREDLVSEEELAKAKAQIAAELFYETETATGQARVLASDMLSAHNPNFSKHYVQDIQKVKREDVRRVARTYFRPDSLSITVLKPQGLPAEAEVTRPEEVSEVKKVVLDSGVRVLLKRIPYTPVVAIQAYFLGGVRLEDEKEAGLSRLTAHMFLRGTKKRSGLEIARALEKRGGEISAASGNNTFYLSARVLKRDFPLGIEILADCIKNPTFPEEELEKLRERTLIALRAQKDESIAEGLRFFRENFFKVSPYRKDPLGSEETVASFSRQDLLSFYSRYAHPANMVLAIFGDIDLSQAADAVRRHFADFKGQGTLTLPQIPSEPPLTQNKRVQKTSEKEEAVVFIGFSGMAFEMREDRFAMDVLDAIISGINYPGGWLHNELRGRGLVYVVHAYNFVGLEPGYFGIYALTRPETVEEVVRIVDKAIERIKTQDVALEELRRAKVICVTNFVMEHQRAQDIAREAALDELYGLGYDFGDIYMQGISAVKPEDIRRVAQKYLTHRLVAVVGLGSQNEPDTKAGSETTQPYDMPEPDSDKEEGE